MGEIFKLFGTIGVDTSEAEKGIDEVTGKAKKSGKGIFGAFTSAAKGIGKIAAGIGVFALVDKGIQMVRDSMDGAIDRYDILNNFPRVMQQLGFDATDSDKAINRLSDGIQGLPTRLDEVASTAQNIAIMTKDLDGATDTTLALNNAFLASGASSQDAERGLQQYVQMLSKGEVDLQSWRTLQETMGLGLNQLAEDFGYTGESAQNDLYDALKDGEITFDEFNAALVEASERTGGFADMAKTSSGGIKTAMTNMGTWVVMGVTKVIEAMDEALGGVGSLEGAINALKPIFDAVFSFIATVILKTGEIVRDLKGRFDDFKEAISPITNAMQPLIDIFQQTADNVISGLQPTLENLMNLFDSLMPIIEILATLLGATLLTAIIIITTAWNGLYSAIIPIINAFINLVDVVVNVVNSIIAVLTGDFQGALDYWNDATESSIEFFKNLWDGVIGFIMGIVDSIIGWFKFLHEILVGNSIIPDMVEEIVEWFQNLLQWLIDIVSNLVDGVVTLFTNLYEKVEHIFTNLWGILVAIWGYIEQTFKNTLSFLKALVTGDFEGMKQSMKNQMENSRQLLSNIWDNIKSLIGQKASQILSDVISKFIEIKNNIQNKITEAKDGAVSRFSEMVSNITGKATEILNDITMKFNAAKDAILNPIEWAKDKIGKIVDEIKNFFSNMELKIPDIERPKLPKFTVSGSFGVNPPSVPKFGIDWFADGGILTKATAFGMNGNNVMVGGEAGREAVLPLNKETLGGIGEGISSTMNWGNEQIIALLDSIKDQITELLSRNETVVIQVDGQTIAVVTEPHITEIQERNEYIAHELFKDK